MSLLLAIDPGLDTGSAILDEHGKLLACALGDPMNPPEHMVVVIERPQVYAGRFSKGDPNDLITLAIQVGRYAERFKVPNKNLVLPHEWKGTIDKKVHHERIWQKLDVYERVVVTEAMKDVAVSKRHNVFDAVGLAKWAWPFKTRWR